MPGGVVISALVPKIRLFRVFNSEFGDLREIEFDFPNHMNPDDAEYFPTSAGFGPFSWQTKSKRTDRWDFGIKELLLTLYSNSIVFGL